MRFLILLLVLAWTGSVVPSARSQADAVELQSGVAMAGLSAYRDGTWSVVRGTLENAGSQPAEPLLLVKQPGEVGRQFGVRAWVPPRSRRVVYAPLLPAGHDPGSRSIEMESQLVRGEAGRETGSTASPSLLVHYPKGAVIAVLQQEGSRAGQELINVLTETGPGVYRTVGLGGENLAGMDREAAWGVLDVLVVSGSVPMGAAQLEAARRWLVAGGRLWVMLGEAGDGAGAAELAEALVGSDWGLAVLGHTQLTDVPVGGLGAEGEPRDDAVWMARVDWPGAEVLHTVGGYPAALRRAVGEGEVLVTTVAPGGWTGETGGAGPWLSGLIGAVEPARKRVQAAGAAGETVLSPAFRSFGGAEVGYEVLSRWAVLAILAGFVVLLAAAGVWAGRTGRREWFAAAGLALAAVAAAALITLGLLRQTEAGETLAQTQIVHHLPNQPYAKVQTLASVYRPPGADTAAGLRGGGGLPLLDGLGPEAGVVRVVWADRDAWAFEVLRPAVGAVQDIGLTRVARVAEPLRLRLRPTPEGVEAAVVPADAEPVSDPLLVTPRGRFALEVNSDGGFLIPLGPPMPAGAFTSGGLLSDLQVRRAALLESLLAGPDAIDRPMLLAWTGGVPDQLRLSDATDQRTAAVTLIPLAWERPPVGTRVALPEAVIGFDVSRKRRGATVYDPVNRSFVPNVTMAQTLWLRFELPEPLLPMTLDGARVTLDLDAPGRPVRVLTERGEREVEAAVLESAMGRRSIDIPAEQLPEPDEGGGLLIGIDVQDPLDPTGMPSPWTLRGVSLSVTGTIGERDEP